MLELIEAVPGVELGSQEYLDDFWRTAIEVGGTLWKLERRQEFRQPESPSWLALDAGDIEESIAITDRHLDEMREQAAAWPFESKRVRIVERPWSLYLRWELMRLERWSSFGEKVRVLPAAAVADRERQRQLPEIVTLGTSILYVVRYDQTGTLSGAIRVEDRRTVEACIARIVELFDSATPLVDVLQADPSLRLAKLEEMA